jgi:hypothetical protein
MKKYLALAAAGGALAIGVPAAFAATAAPTQNTPVQSATPAPDQSRPDDGGRDHNCPDEDGGNQGSAGNSDTTL